MRNRNILYAILCLTFFAISCNSSNTANTEAETTTDTVATTTTPTPAPKTMESFVLEGYEILDSKKGEVNGDAYEDVVLILKAKNEAEVSDYAGNKPSLRPMLILTGDANGSLNLAARSDKAVLCVDCGGQMGDAFSGLVIKDKYIEITHYGGGGNNNWSRVLAFGFDAEKSGFVLQHDGEESFNPTNAKQLKSAKDAMKRVEDFDIYQ